MWIDFKLYFYVSNHKGNGFCFEPIIVVNWFQIVFLREQSQVSVVSEDSDLSCELISNCIFTWAITRSIDDSIDLPVLWIDFKLYFYVSNHKATWKKCEFLLVVNWFQIVFLREQSQAIVFTGLISVCCELISNCIFTWAITSA